MARMHGVVSEMLKGLSSSTGAAATHPAGGGGSPLELDGLTQSGELVGWCREWSGVGGGGCYGREGWTLATDRVASTRLFLVFEAPCVEEAFRPLTPKTCFFLL